MFRSLVLVRGFVSMADALDFGDFTMCLVGHRVNHFNREFSTVGVEQSDWVLERWYPNTESSDPFVIIVSSVEDTLLLFRLYKAGELSFVRHVIIPPNGLPIVQLPNRTINDLNGRAEPKFEIAPMEAQLWKGFGENLQQSQSWRATWFSIARRFFLAGTSKRFSYPSGDMDRIVDYATALEATLVPERSDNTLLISRRATALLASSDSHLPEEIVSFVRKFYNIRSRIVHGGHLDRSEVTWLIGNIDSLESRVRQILVAAVHKLPAGEHDRHLALTHLYSPSDQHRANSAFERFRKINTQELREATLSRITEWLSKQKER